jgi:tripartite-type tricarboxylate transporter receptor subunit TctC
MAQAMPREEGVMQVRMGWIVRLVVSSVAILTTGFTGYAAAQPYPAKPIRPAVGFPPGVHRIPGARIIAPKLSELLGQQVIRDNRPGANTNRACSKLPSAQRPAVISSMRKRRGR